MNRLNKIIKKLKIGCLYLFATAICLINLSFAQNDKTMDKFLKENGYKSISVTEIDGNTFTMFHNDWALVTAGTEKSYNTMTIGWGDFGVLWNKNIITVYVSSSRYTKQFMDNNEYFTVEFFDEEYREALVYLGSHSGRNEDKVANSKLTTIFTPLQNATFKESKLIIEAKKIYSHEFEESKLPVEIKDWYKQRMIGLHTMYIGEILNVWIKE